MALMATGSRVWIFYFFFGNWKPPFNFFFGNSLEGKTIVFTAVLAPKAPEVLFYKKNVL